MKFVEARDEVAEVTIHARILTEAASASSKDRLGMCRILSIAFSKKR